MKKFLLILILAIFCLPNEGFAQRYGTPGYYGERIRVGECALASIWAAGKYGGTVGFVWNSKPKKQKPRINRVHLLAIENTIDEATGLTTLRWNDGSTFVGQTIRKALLVGTMIYPDSSRYSGQWRNNLPNGSGTFINPEGVAFTGKFKNGEPHGKCIIQDTDGRLYQARWYYGKLRKHSIKPLKQK